MTKKAYRDLRSIYILAILLKNRYSIDWKKSLLFAENVIDIYY